MAPTTYQQWLADGSRAFSAHPTEDLARTLHAHGYNVGRLDVVGLGDERHLTATTPQDHTPYSHTPWPGEQPYPYVLAFDIMTPVPPGMPSLTELAQKLFDDKRTGRPGMAWLKYMNWTDALGRCWHDSWKPNWARVSSTDKGHIHLSCRTDYTRSTGAADYDPIRELLEDDVSPEEHNWLKNVYEAFVFGGTDMGRAYSPPVIAGGRGNSLVDKLDHLAAKADEPPPAVPVELSPEDRAAVVADLKAALLPDLLAAVAALPAPLSHKETEQAAFEGAQRAERE